MFLDWKQAFDSIDHNSMLVALERFGISATALKIIQGIYKDPTGEKAEGVVGSGIWQGCPFSPYLFIMVLIIISEDVDYA